MATELPKIAAPAQRALAAINVTSLEALENFSRKEILDLHGMGPNAFGNIEAAMKEAGFEFKANSSPT